MSDIDIVEILHDIANEQTNSVGDYWSLDNCREAAREIQRLRDGLMAAHDYINCGFNAPQDFLDEIKELSHYKSLADALQEQDK